MFRSSVRRLTSLIPYVVGSCMEAKAPPGRRYSGDWLVPSEPDVSFSIGGWTESVEGSLSRWSRGMRLRCSRGIWSRRKWVWGFSGAEKSVRECSKGEMGGSGKDLGSREHCMVLGL